MRVWGYKLWLTEPYSMPFLTEDGEVFTDMNTMKSLGFVL